jgi:hypothetical protein
MKLRAPLILLALAAGGCKQRFVEVDHPFYLGHREDPEKVALFRCPDGPDSGCAADGLPGPVVISAGADSRFVVVRARRGYYYFARVPQETYGWGNNPERIVGPLNSTEFARAKKQLRLPDPAIQH